MKTLRGKAAQSFDLPAARRGAPFIKWQKLEVLCSEMEGDTGLVEFKAHFRFKGKLSCLHEVSRFSRTEGGMVLWVWLTHDLFTWKITRIDRLK